MNDEVDLAIRVLRELSRLGVREFCIAAGSRNAPLVVPLLASRGVRVWNFFDERSAAFFALGRMMADRAPVAVITTSGTAAGELLPAVMEAHYQGLPLTLVTADRPKRFRGTGAPQAVEQVQIFGTYAGKTIDLDCLSSESAWPRQLELRPVHVNVCFEEQLTCDGTGIEFPPFTHEAPVPSHVANDRARSILEAWLENRDHFVVLAGALHPSRVEAVAGFLCAVNAPIVADAASNLHLCAALRDLHLPGGEAGLRRLPVSRVLRIGGVPAGRWWRDLESRADIAVLNVCEPGFPGLARTENVETGGYGLLDFRCAHCAGACAPMNRSDFDSRLDALLEEFPHSEPAWIRHLSRVIPEGARVFLGNSLPVREWNLAAAAPRQCTTFFANRGTNGIDGLVSTFLGMSATTGESWLVIGDLSTLYDLGAPWILRQLPPGRRRIVVINNGGGKIFSRIESLSRLPCDTREIIENRHSLSFGSWARMWGLPYVQATGPAQLAVLPDDAAVIEIVPDAAATDAFWRQWTAA